MMMMASVSVSLAVFGVIRTIFMRDDENSDRNLMEFNYKSKFVFWNRSWLANGNKNTLFDVRRP